MFNLFGSLFFGNKSNQAQPEPQAETVLQHAETQTSPELQSEPQVQIQIETDVPQTDKANGLDWVLVERCDEAPATEMANTDDLENTSIMEHEVQDETIVDAEEEQQKSEENLIFERQDDDNDIILGSFFEKNQNSNDDGERYKTSGLVVDEDDEIVEEAPNKDWLITPLPYLTSITASQRSIVENDPLENLLIEHPSMSVFVTATSSDLDLEQDNYESTESTEMIIVMQSNGKGKSAKKAENDTSVVQVESASLRKLRAKRNKKSQSGNSAAALASLGAGKENYHARSLLLNESVKKPMVQFNKNESVLLKKNQMNRNNKNATFKSNKNNNVNSNKRKYHKLQQPILFNNSTNY